MSRTHSVALLSILLCSIVSGTAGAVQRAHVSTSGLDSNTAFNCDVARPCRFFQAASTVVDPNGEVVVLDSGGFGAVNLTKSISLIAPTGVHAGISVFPGSDGVTIATPGINVVLRGITINGLGGNNGISMTAGTSLSVEDCVISNFTGSGNIGIFVNTAAKVKIIDTLLRDSDQGIQLQGGAIATIARTRLVGIASFGIFVFGITAGTTTSASISDTNVSGVSKLIADKYGIFASAGSGNVRASVIRSIVSNFNVGVASVGPSGTPTSTSLLTLSESTVTENTYGLYRSGPTATFESLGNNMVHLNLANTLGTITLAAPL